MSRRALPWLPAALGLVLWAVGLATTDAQHLPTWGLLARLTWPWWLGLALVVPSAFVLALGRPLRHGPLGAHLGVLLLQLYATAPALEGAPRYTYTYKHVAIAQYIERYGSVDSSIDIYHRWPGFFSLSAWFSQLTGLYDPSQYAAWSELWFSALDVLLVWTCVQAVSRSRRTAWQATLLFAVSNWVGQNYYAPQAFGYVLMLGVLLLCLVALRGRPGGFGRWVEGRLELLLRVPALRRDDPRPASGTQLRRVVGLAVLLDAVLAATHQLTPYVLLLQLTALVLGGYLRPWWFLFAAGTATVGYLVPNYDFVVNTFGILTSADPLANATSKTVDGFPNTTQRTIQYLALASLLVCFVLAFTGMVRRARRGLVSDAVVLGVLAFAPVLTLAAQNYGGEARLRVFLYALPWLCAGVSWSWSPEGEPRSAAGLLAPLAVAGGLTVAFVAFFLGREDINQLTPDEVGAAAFLFDPETVQPGAVVMLLAPNFPARYGPLYFRLARSDLPALSYDDFRERPLLFPSELDVEAAAEAIVDQGGNGGYLVFTQGQEAFAREYQLYPEHGLKAFEGVVAQSSRFRLVYDRPTARVYALVPDKAAP